MNASKLTLERNPRLDRIKLVSRAAKYVCFAVLIFSIGEMLWWPSGLQAGYWQFLELSDFQNAPLYSLLCSLFQILFLAWYWQLARLFQLYERGLIFAGETIRCIKALGLVCVTGWLFGSSVNFLPFSGLLMQPVLSPGIIAPVLVSHTFRIRGFFDFHFGTGIDFGLLFAGVTIVLAAWIMDEGRKISEEQALTV